jgi:hypothetical protein
MSISSSFLHITLEFVGFWDFKTEKWKFVRYCKLEIRRVIKGQ